MTEETTNDSELKTYEIGYLLSPFIPEEGIEEAVERIFKTAVEGVGGRITTSPTPRMRKLAYSVAVMQGHKRNNYNDAYFGALRFECLPQGAIELKSILDKNPEVVRYLILAIPKNAPAMTLKVTTPVRIGTPVGEGEPALAEKEKPELSEAEIDKEIEGLLSPNI